MLSLMGRRPPPPPAPLHLNQPLDNIAVKYLSQTYEAREASVVGGLGLG